MKFAASTSLKRAGAVVAIGVALLSATACGPIAIGQQPTTIVYAASDGVSANISSVKLRNIMVISSGENSRGRLLGTVLNEGDSDETITFKFASGNVNISVPAGEEVRLESAENETILSPTGANPGLMLTDTEITVGSESTHANIPVLDGTLEEYAPYLPSASETGAPSDSATPEFESSVEATTIN